MPHGRQEMAAPAVNPIGNRLPGSKFTYCGCSRTGSKFFSNHSSKGLRVRAPARRIKMMSVILLVLGILVTGIGLVAIGFGFPINESGFGQTLIIAGATALVGG